MWKSIHHKGHEEHEEKEDFNAKSAKGLRFKICEATALDSVIPAWSAGIQIEMDVSGASCELDAGNPCRHDEDLHFNVRQAERKIMNHSFVVKSVAQCRTSPRLDSLSSILHPRSSLIAA